MNNEYVKIGVISLIVSVVVSSIFHFVISSDNKPVAKPLASHADTNNQMDVAKPAVNTDRFNQAAVNSNDNNLPIENPERPTADIKFNEYTHDYGTVKQLSDNEHTFKFTNTGDVPLVIEQAQGSCGCTVPSWPKEPIMPNETGEIQVVFTPKKGQLGKDEKTVTVTANVPTKTVVLRIKADVVE